MKVKDEALWFFLFLFAVWEVLSDFARRASDKRMSVLEARVDELEEDRSA